MGITTSMGLLKFALLGIDLLGWPVIALGFPLFASIRAVETGSRYHMRKLVIYWTLFSLFSLFEFAFEKIIDWIPFWSVVRLIVSFSLVMPQFEGACLAYQGLVRSVIDRFGMLKEERLSKRENFWNVVEKYIKENGPEALEKLIALEMTRPEARVENRRPETPPIKKSQQEWTCRLCKVTNMGESTLNAHLQGSQHKSKLVSLKASLLDEKDTGPSFSRQVQHAHSFSAAWDLKGTYAAAEFKERIPPKEPENRLLKKAQQEWTCDLCKVTTASKSMLNAHLQGSKHKSKLESPKASLLDANDAGPSPLVQHTQSVSAACDLNGTYAAAEFKEVMPPTVTAEEGHTETPLLKKAQPEWTCDLCKVTTMSEIMLNGHFQGRKHKAKLETILKESLLDAKYTGPSSPLVQHAQSVSAAWDLNGTFEAAEDKEILPSKETAKRRLPETPLLNKAQQEWTGDLCKVTTESESTLNDHLEGSNHKSKLETTPETNLLDAKDTGPSPPVQHTQSVSAACNLNGTPAAAEVKEIMPPKETADKWRPETRLLKKAQPEWTSDLCKVTTTSEITLNGHLQGREHKAKLETILKESMFDAKDTEPSSPLMQQAQPVSAAWDLNGTFEAADDKEIMPPKETAKRRLPETPLLKKAQQEWTGDLCKVTTESESTLNDYLQGSYHKSKLETTLEASLLDEKDTGPSPPVQHAQSVSVAWGLNGAYAAFDDKEISPPQETAEKRLPEIPLLKKAQQELTGDLCEVTTESESTLNDYLQGSNHKSKLETTLEASLLDAKDTGPSPSVKHAQSVSAASVLKGTYAGAEVSEIFPPKETAEKRGPVTPLFKKPQREWTCDLCKVTTTSEITLNAHLHGGKHKAMLDTNLKDSLNELEKIIASKTGHIECSNSHRDVQVVESKVKNGSSASQEVQYAQSNVIPKRTDANAKVKETMPPPEASRAETPPPKKEWRCGLCGVKVMCEKNLNDHLRGSKHKSQLESVKQLKEWSCGLCRVKVTCEKNLNDHLLGSKHKSKLESLKQWKGKLVVLEVNGEFKHLCIICNAKLLSDVDLASHVKGKRHASSIAEMDKLEM